MTKKKKVILIILATLVVLFVGTMWFLAAMIYDDNFDDRLETYEPKMFRVDDFDGLSRTRYEFQSDKEQKLVGYMYKAGEGQKAIIMLAHGLGAGHNYYMDIINCFAQRGYYVFAYDATGNDESEGQGVIGLPQGVIDLDHAISFVEENNDFPDLPICLFGHSWGAFSASNVLTFHPEVKAVVEVSGWNRASDMFESEGKRQAGAFIYLMMPFVKLHEWIHFGKYSSNSALDGFEASDAAVMVVHSEDDNVVPIEVGYDTFYEKYKDDPRFEFVRFKDKGHNYILNDSSNTYMDEFNAEWMEWLNAQGYDYNAEENQSRLAEDKANYLHEHLDRQKYAGRSDMELVEKFVEFYDKHVGR